MERRRAMNIVDRSPDDISITEAAHLAGVVSAKTVRRALADCDLPRRYILTARGPQLVFSRADLERWIAGRKARRQLPATDPSLAATAGPSALHDAVQQLQ